jgi:hypothetical protein
VQGYAIARPLPADALLDWLKQAQGREQTPSVTRPLRQHLAASERQ